MKTIVVADTPWRETYARLTEIVQPRPIALVSTLDPEMGPDGGPNLAPFSFFTIISSNPLYLAFSPQIAARTGANRPEEPGYPRLRLPGPGPETVSAADAPAALDHPSPGQTPRESRRPSSSTPGRMK